MGWGGGFWARLMGLREVTISKRKDFCFRLFQKKGQEFLFSGGAEAAGHGTGQQEERDSYCGVLGCVLQPYYFTAPPISDLNFRP